jgi:nitrogen-specific signal transduction histidine kinase/CheY-like chemotaxis protein
MKIENEVLRVEKYPDEFVEEKCPIELNTCYFSMETAGNAFTIKSENQIKFAKKHDCLPSLNCILAEEKLRESEKNLQKSQKMEALRTLTGGIAHEFNNLLTAIIGNAQLALFKIEPENPLQRRLSEIEKAANRASVLIRQLLTFSRRQILERRTVDLNEIISDIEKLLRRIVGEDVIICSDYAADLDAIYADRSQIEQVIMNLVVNAREAMPGGGNITIETKNVELGQKYPTTGNPDELEKYVQVTITDTGKGIDEEKISSIFDPFFTTKEVGDGSGLGLSIAYGIIDQHDGWIEVESEIGQGACFKIFFPASKSNDESKEIIFNSKLYAGTETVLVAEDEEVLRDLAKDFLTKLGYRVLIAENGEEAVNCYAGNSDQIDVLLLDIVMPRMGGIETYNRIKALKTATTTPPPAIFMSGYSVGSQKDGLSTGVVSNEKKNIKIIQKPYNMIDLGRELREVLDKPLQEKQKA